MRFRLELVYNRFMKSLTYNSAVMFSAANELKENNNLNHKLIIK